MNMPEEQMKKWTNLSNLFLDKGQSSLMKVNVRSGRSSLELRTSSRFIILMKTNLDQLMRTLILRNASMKLMLWLSMTAKEKTWTTN